MQFKTYGIFSNSKQNRQLWLPGNRRSNLLSTLRTVFYCILNIICRIYLLKTGRIYINYLQACLHQGFGPWTSEKNLPPYVASKALLSWWNRCVLYLSFTHGGDKCQGGTDPPDNEAFPREKSDAKTIYSGERRPLQKVNPRAE